MAAAGAPRRSRLQELLAGYPPATLALTAVCVACYLYTLVDDVNLGAFSTFPYKAIYDWQFYRVFTSAVFHGGFMHIAMNMMSFQALGTSLERLFGSSMFMLLNLYIILLSGFLYLGVCWALTYAMSDVSWLAYQSVGYSGVLFALAMFESFLSPARTRSVFGLFTVPTRLYPFVLLVVLQVIMPNISLLGHLSGLLVGLLYVVGYLDWLIPSFAAVQEVESKAFMGPMRRLHGFVPCPERNPVTHAAGNGDQRSTRAMAVEMLTHWMAPLWRCLRVPFRPLYTYVIGPAAAAVQSAVARGPRAQRQTNWGGGLLGDGAEPQPRPANTAVRRDTAVAANARADVEMGELPPVSATPVAASAPAAAPPPPQPAARAAAAAAAAPGAPTEPTDAELYDFSESDDEAAAEDAPLLP